MIPAKVSIVGFVAAVVGMLAPLGVASANPIEPHCFDARLCGDLSDATYCPDTGRKAGPFTACDSLVTGPYAPGGLRPNQSIWDDE